MVCPKLIGEVISYLEEKRRERSRLKGVSENGVAYGVGVLFERWSHIKEIVAAAPIQLEGKSYRTFIDSAEKNTTAVLFPFRWVCRRGRSSRSRSNGGRSGRSW